MSETEDSHSRESSRSSSRKESSSSPPTTVAAATAVATSPSLPHSTTSTSTSSSSSSSSTLSARFVSGSIGSLVTAFAITPLEVAKVHFQNARPATIAHAATNTASASGKPTTVSPCPKGCGVFVLNNGLFDCVLAKSKVPYFDKKGNLITTTTTNNGTNSSTSTSTSTTNRATVGANNSQRTASAIMKANTTSRKQLGIFAVIRAIFWKDGLRGIYAGLGPTLLMGVPSAALYYTCYDELVDQGQHHAPDVVIPYLPLMAGSSARLLTTLVTSPLELVRTRQASAVGEGLAANSMMEEFRLLIRSEGCSGLYRGLAPLLWRDVPFSGIYWMCLETFKRQLGPMVIASDHRPTPLQQVSISFASGCAAGMVAAAITTPFDVVKTRQSTAFPLVAISAVTTNNAALACNHGGHVVYQSAHETAPTHASSSVFSHLRNIYETEGLKSLWRGNQTRMIKVAPSCGIMIACYELGKRFLESPIH